ncbi:PqqD family protein [Pseudomonadota bacterium]
MPPNISPDVNVQHVGDETLVLDLNSGQIHQLNTTAAWILAQCNGENSIESIVSNFAEHFSLDSETATSDVAGTIEQLMQVNVIDSE